MRKNTRKIIYAISTFVGTIVGVGMFGLPYIASKIGFIPMMFYLIGGAIITLAVNLIHAEFLIASSGKKRLAGYVKEHFGDRWGFFAFIIFLIGMYGSMLAYIIVGGKFLQGIIFPFFPISLLCATVIYFIIGTLLIYNGIKSISQAEFLMMMFLIILVFIFSLISFPKINLNNFLGTNLDNIFLPYGIVLFSFWGTSILPEIKEEFLKSNKKEKYLEKGKRDLKMVIFYSTVMPLIIYAIFVAAVLGISGKVTSSEAFSGLEPFLSNKIIYIGYIFGFLSVFTSYISIGLSVKNSFLYDYKIKEKLSFFCACFIPFIFFLLGFNNFISVINLVGTITFGIAGIFIFLLYLKLKKEKKIKKSLFPSFVIYVLMIIFLMGIFMSLKKY